MNTSNNQHPCEIFEGYQEMKLGVLYETWGTCRKLLTVGMITDCLAKLHRPIHVLVAVIE